MGLPSPCGSGRYATGLAIRSAPRPSGFGSGIRHPSASLVLLCSSATGPLQDTRPPGLANLEIARRGTQQYATAAHFNNCISHIHPRAGVQAAYQIINRIMKNTLFAALAFLFASPALYAQGVYLGPRIGAHFANVKWDGENKPDSDNRTAVLYGAALELPITRHLKLQPEVNYVVRGYTSESEILGANVARELKLNYLDFGGLLKIKTNDEGLHAYLGAGAFYSYALSGETTFNVGNVSQTNEIEFDREESYERGDLSLALGAGVQLPLGQSFLFADARYLYGLNDVDNQDNDVEIKNRGLSLSAGLLFPL